MADVKKSDEALLVALAYGLSVEQAAKQTGISARTIHRRLEDVGFQARLDQLRYDMLTRSSAMLTAAGIESVKTLVDLLKPSQPAMTRLSAAKSILDLGVKLRSLVEVEFRMKELENRINDLPKPGGHA
jgi:hypothetical protein